MNTKMLGTALGLGLLLGALPAGAHNLNPPTSKVTGLSANAQDGVVSVSGTATFGGQRLKTIGTDPTGDTNLPPPYDIVAGKIGQLDANNGDLTFVFKVADLPAGTSPPEVARYTWDFGIDMGGDTPVPLQIDGKFTDVVRNQSTRVGGAFALRGNCFQDGSIITCEKVADLTAEYVAADDEIFVDVPKTVLAEQAKGPVDGRELVPATVFEGIGVYPSAYFSLSGTGDNLEWDFEANPFRIGYKRVRIGMAPTGQQPAQMVDATVSDGGFEGTLSTAGLASGTYDVVAEACFGANCGTSIVQVTV